MARIYNDITATIGRSPLVRINRLTKGLKAEVVLPDTGERYLSTWLFQEELH